MDPKQELLSSQNIEKFSASSTKTKPFRLDEGITDRQNENENSENTRSSQIKMRQLSDENSQLLEQIERLKLQVNQIDAYKNQTINLKKQLTAAEEKIKFYDLENNRKQGTLEEQLTMFNTKESQLMQELDKKCETIDSLEKKLNSESTKTSELMKNIETQQAENRNLAEQITELTHKIDNLTNEIDAQQNSFNEERNLLERTVFLTRKLKKIDKRDGN